MNFHSVELLTFGLLAIIAGVFFLISIVRELAPVDRRNWFLSIGLGTGIIAFTLKIGLIVAFSASPSPFLDIFPKPNYKHEQVNQTYQPSYPAQSHSLNGAYTWQALPNSAPVPANNPMSPDKIALGKKLFFDPRLSADNSLSCASCHEVSEDKGGGDGQIHSIGIKNQKGNRNAPTVLNAAFQRVLFWDGRASSLEEQAKGPLINPVEMGMPSLHAVVDKLQGISDYRQAFKTVFPDSATINIDNIAKAIAAYERTLITPNSPYDRFVQGDNSALSPSQLRGMALFETTGCIVCHSGPNFSGASIFGSSGEYRIFPAIPNTEYETKYQLTKDKGIANNLPQLDRGIWRIPSLRNVSRTAPYFHNGSVDNLEEAVRIMARVQLNKKISNKIDDDQKLSWSNQNLQLNRTSNHALSDNEIKDIVAFLKALDGELPE